MTIPCERLELRLLGALEVSVDGSPLVLGGGKQRAVLAVLLLSADEVVPVTRLVDEVWGESPPPSAAHSLEVYVSRLRQLLGERGPLLQRLGAGYRLRLGDATLDARSFVRLSEEASLAAAMGDDERASALACTALALWRGPVLADVTLSSTGRVDAERLEELRLRTHEQRFDAELALGRHDEIAGELQALVDQCPYRERFVAQLMLALYRSGRHVEALQAYERTRRALADDVGLQPSADLQQLSGRIVRQDPELTVPGRVGQAPVRGGAKAARPPRVGRRRPSVGALTAAATAAVLTLAAGGATSAAGAPSAPVATRVALVLPATPDPAHLFDLHREYITGLQGPALLATPSLRTRTLVAPDTDLDRVDAVAADLRHGGYGLVLWVGDGAAAQRILPTVRQLAGTRFVFLDASADTLGLADLPNASAIRFAEEQTAELVGYLSGLVEPRGGMLGSQVDVVGYVGGVDTRVARKVAAAIERGLQRVRPNGTVLVGFTNDVHDRTACERLANEQVDRGADVVVADAGDCGIGALAVAVTRGVWGVGEEDVRGGRETWDRPILARRYKEPKSAVELAVRGYLRDTLPPGGEQILDLQDDYAVSLWNVNYQVPEEAWSRVVDLCSDIRKHTSTPQPDGASAEASASARARRISPSSA